MTFNVKILADSVSPVGVRLTTMECTYPRIIHAEIMTHRMLSKNAASSRAIPVEKMIRMVEESPYVPVVWGKNQKGMQSEEFMTHPAEVAACSEEWLTARDSAVAHAKKLLDLGVHKQWTNRLLEPFMWYTCIITGTEWSNFFNLRAHKDAHPDIRAIAIMMKEAYDSHTPKALGYGEWHLPLIQDNEFVLPDNSPEWNEPLGFPCHLLTYEEAIKISVGRCARVSYLTHDGRRDTKEDIALYDRLVAAGHMSPLEHVATPDPKEPHNVFIGNLKGWIQYRKLIPNEFDILGAE